MKKIIFILFVLFLGCTVTSKVQEGVFYKTRVYAGIYAESTPINETYTMIETSQGIFKLKLNPEIPDSASCYIRIEYSSYDFHPDIAEQMAVRYFTWEGSDLEYKIFNDIKNLK